MVHDAHMRESTDRVQRALDRLGADVTATLEASGWASLSLRQYALRTFTLATHDGMMATAEICRTSFSSRNSLPVTIQVTIGVGYRPALDLMPLLTLPADADLMPMGDAAGRPSLRTSLDSDDDIATVAAQIVALIDGQALPFAEGFADVDAIDLALQDLERGHADDEFPDRRRTTTRLTLLTSAGRHREARDLLATFVPLDRADRRFQRQLTRWLDAGRTAIPPVEETLALLPSKPDLPRPSLVEARAQAAAKKEATDSVRARARGKSVDELTRLLAIAYAERAIPVSTARLTSAAALMELQQQPFGRLRAAVRGLSMLASVGADAVDRFRDGVAADPQWLQPPERASFPIDGARSGKATIRLDPDAADVIARVAAEAPARLGFLVDVDVWFDHHEGQVVAHIGERRVGTLDPTDAVAFAAVFRAAAIFDEAPFVRGRLADIEGAPVSLEVPMPAGLA
jgi:hypothetical protein